MKSYLIKPEKEVVDSAKGECPMVSRPRILELIMLETGVV